MADLWVVAKKTHMWDKFVVCRQDVNLPFVPVYAGMSGVWFSSYG